MHKPHDGGKEDVHLLRQEQGFPGYNHLWRWEPRQNQGLGKDSHHQRALNIECISSRVAQAQPSVSYQAGKHVGSTHHNKNVMTTSRPLELLHMDLFGPVAYLSIGGSKYGLVIVDDFSRFTWVLFLQDKSETQGTLKCF
jgi:hypothetical protein